MSAEYFSVLRFLNDTLNIQMYTNTLPIGFKKPSVYIQQPTSQEATAALNFEFEDKTIKLTFFGQSVAEASNLSANVKDALLEKRKQIPYVYESGELSKYCFSVRNIGINSSMSDSTATLTMSYTLDRRYGRANAPSVENVNLNSEVKERE